MHISIDNHYLSVLSRTVNSVKEITEGDLAELLFTKAQVEWREGISPSRSPRTGHEPLDSSGSYRPAADCKSCQWAKSHG
jgi:hypothetical protein